MEDTVVFPGMGVTMTVDVGDDERVVLVPHHESEYLEVGVVAEVSERMRLPGGGRAVALNGEHRALIGAASTGPDGALRVKNAEAPYRDFAMVRQFIAALLALLLVGTQLELVVHEVDHLRAKIDHSKSVGIENAGGDVCLECALLAGSSNAAPGCGVTLQLAATESSAVTAGAGYQLALAGPSHYQSRAPPVLL